MKEREERLELITSLPDLPMRFLQLSGPQREFRSLLVHELLSRQSDHHVEKPPHFGTCLLAKIAEVMRLTKAPDVV